MAENTAQAEYYQTFFQNDDADEDFDPIVFAQQIIDTIQEYRSDSGTVPNTIVVNAQQVGTGDSGEDRLNTFYRLIGLPAVRTDVIFAGSIKGEFESEDHSYYIQAVSQNQTLNYVKPSQLSNTEEISRNFKERISLTTKKIYPVDYQIMLDTPLAISASISGASGRKASIIPPVVDASIPVFPVNHRVAPAFYNGDFTDPSGRTRLSRPFLEHIIYMRSKVFSGARTELVDQIKKNIQKETNNDEMASQLPEKFPEIEQAIVNKFIQAIKQSAKRYARAISKATELKSKVSFVATPTEDPGQRSLFPVSGSPDVSATVIGTKRLSISNALAVQDSFLISLPIESVNRSDRIRRLDDEIAISNIKPDVFVSGFIEILSSERRNLQTKMDTIDAEESAYISEFERVKQEIMLFSGEFTGLSIFDVLCVLYALFTIEIKYLVGLLNEDSKNRLKADKFFKANKDSTGSIQTTDSSSDLIGADATIAQSVAELEGQIMVAFQLAESFLVTKATRASGT